jgi:lysyl-tRNA synthetase class 2
MVFTLDIERIKNMKMINVVSSNISQIGFIPYEDDTKGSLYVRFKSDKLYVYHKVPHSIHQEFLSSESHGKYLNKEIKPYYDYDLIENEPKWMSDEDSDFTINWSSVTE